MDNELPQGLLKLPVELRMEIYNHLLKPSQISLMKIPSITGLPVVTAQPPLSLVNRKLREEVLNIFYSSNTFVLRLFDLADVETMSHYLTVIGDHRIARFRYLSLCSWAKLGFGHMLFKWWWRVDINLKDGTAVWDREITWADELRLMESFKTSYRSFFEAKHGTAWTAEDLIEVMKVFVLTCTAY